MGNLQAASIKHRYQGLRANFDHDRVAAPYDCVAWMPSTEPVTRDRMKNTTRQRDNTHDRGRSTMDRLAFGLRPPIGIHCSATKFFCNQVLLQPSSKSCVFLYF